MLFQATSFFALVAFIYAQVVDPSINTPASLVQCQPALITWTATKTPVFVSIIPGGQPGAAALIDFGAQNSSSLTWNVDMAAGSSITFQVRDATGAVAYSAPVTVQTSSDASCVEHSASVAPTSAAPTSTMATATTQPRHR
ncbi:unnamed protein product [Rhizoctonia solani]|uniref:Secreted protein n=1 Tax=Rhizoctonia solani TaxID=456999 RepID=A0A8H3GLT2_9AGAM|nr:unnamed protein product [Rhizoctonia solani]CAE6460844.1 unnamed protein product [Rhizoctonia solani]